MNPDSPYAQLVEVRESNKKSMVESNSITSNEVAKVILKSVTSLNPDLRYVVGDDAARLLESKNSMPDIEFKKLMMSNFLGESKSKILK